MALSKRLQAVIESNNYDDLHSSLPKQKGIQTMGVLIDHSADINFVSKRWGTPLMYAVLMEKEAYLQLLLERARILGYFASSGRLWLVCLRWKGSNWIFWR
jgi:hypothetical protein